jgi:hypothetical protein
METKENKKMERKIRSKWIGWWSHKWNKRCVTEWLKIKGSRYSSVGVANMLWVQRPRDRGSIASRSKMFLSHLQRRDWPPSLVTLGCGAGGNKQNNCLWAELSGFLSQHVQLFPVLTASGACLPSSPVSARVKGARTWICLCTSSST